MKFLLEKRFKINYNNNKFLKNIYTIEMNYFLNKCLENLTADVIRTQTIKQVFKKLYDFYSLKSAYDLIVSNSSVVSNFLIEFNRNTFVCSLYLLVLSSLYMIPMF